MKGDKQLQCSYEELAGADYGKGKTNKNSRIRITTSFQHAEKKVRKAAVKNILQIEAVLTAQTVHHLETEESAYGNVSYRHNIEVRKRKMSFQIKFCYPGPSYCKMSYAHQWSKWYTSTTVSVYTAPVFSQRNMPFHGVRRHLGE